MYLLKKSTGQSTIEFLVTFGFTLLLIFVLLKIALNITNGYYIHYATYSASRAFLVADNFTGEETGTSSDALAETKAKDVFDALVSGNIVTMTAQKIGLAGKSVFMGIRAEFTQEFAFSNVIGGEQPLKFISESYIGRSPIMSECVVRTCQAMQLIDAGITCNLNVTLDDNGC